MDQQNLVSDFRLAVATQAFDEADRLLALGQSIDEADENGATTLMWVTYLGYLEPLRWLIQRGADVNARTREYQTAAHEAATAHKAECLKVLAAAGAQLNAKDIAGDTPAHWAARLGTANCMDVLAENGANLGQRNYKGSAPLHEALHFGYELTSMLEVFVRRGTDLNLGAAGGRTALHMAAMSSQITGVEQLICAGASPLAVDREGNTPLHLAQHPRVKELLLSAPGARQGFATQLLAGGKPFDNDTLKRFN
jgi:ankyrin repeat protein